MKKQFTKKRSWNKFSISILILLSIFLIFIATVIITGCIAYLAIKTGIIGNASARNPVKIMVTVLFACVIIGTILSFIVRPVYLKPIKELIKATEKLASGDFSVRLEVKGPTEINSFIESFNRMAEELDNIEVLRTDFINNFSHEFKTPIVSIKGFAEMLKHTDLTQAERDEYLDIVIDESSRLAALATNVLNMSKVETQTILSSTAHYNLSEQIRQCIFMMDAKIEKKKIDLSADIDDLKINGNKELLSQVWINLLDNAIKFTPDNGLISLSVKQQDAEAIIAIKDTGCGISKDDIPRIFEKFYQADTSHATAGNGIGLSMARKIIELHNGKISCESAMDVGSTFTVHLPLE